MEGIGSITVTKILGAYNVPVNEGTIRKKSDRFSYAVCFALSGKCLYRCSNGDYLSDPQHILLIPKNSSYTLECPETGIFPLINFDAIADESLNEFIEIEVDNQSDYIALFNKLKDRLFFKSGHSHLSAMSTMYDLLTRLYHASITREEKNNYNIIRPAILYLEEHYNDPSLTNAALAEKAFISDVYFRKIFKQKFGVSPKQFILMQRVEKAKELLRDEHQSVSAIAEAVGYASVYHFSRSFKKITGYSPSEYSSLFGSSV